MKSNSKRGSFFEKLRNFQKRKSADRFNSEKFREVNRFVKTRVDSHTNPVLFFNVSTRLTRTSLNAAFSWLSGASLQAGGVPVEFLVCRSGLKPCLLGTDRDNLSKPLPCSGCMALSDRMYDGLRVTPLTFQEDPVVFNEVEGLELDALSAYTHHGVPLGELTLPSMRWILRRHHLENAPNATRLFRMYLRSAWSVYLQMSDWVRQNQPRAIVVFNGLQFPEAVVRWIGRQADIPTFTHEIGLMPETAFFTAGEATATPIVLPTDLEMTDERNKKLDQYLDGRMQGKFKTAGVQFWPQMDGLTPDFWNLVRPYKQIVTIFTNVIFDTSQEHANTTFDNMFVWLEQVRSLIEKNTDTFFVLRAHPDELRPGKESLETVSDWVSRVHLTHLPNVLYIAPDQYFSSYDLIRIAKFVMVYNSTIGLEAAAMGAAVLSGGKSRFTQTPITWFPENRDAYLELVQRMLDADEWQVPPEYRENARKFLYYQFYHAALDFRSFLSPDHVWNGYVKLEDFKPEAILAEKNQTMQVIQDGILNGKDFVLPHE